MALTPQSVAAGRGLQLHWHVHRLPVLYARSTAGRPGWSQAAQTLTCQRRCRHLRTWTPGKGLKLLLRRFAAAVQSQRAQNHTQRPKPARALLASLMGLSRATRLFKWLPPSPPSISTSGPSAPSLRGRTRSSQAVPVSSRIMLDFLHDAKGTMMAVRANSAGTGRESATGGSGSYGKDSARLTWAGNRR